VPFLTDSFGAYLHAYFLRSVGATVAGSVCIVLLVGLNLGPATWVGRAESWIVGVKIGLLLVLIGWGLAAFSGSHFKPLNPHGSGALFTTSALLFTAYTGFNVVTNMAPSVRDPAKTVPRAVIAAVLISMVLYMLVVVAMLDSGIKEFGLAGVSQAADALMGHWGGQMIAFAACLSTFSGANAMVLGGSEIALRLVVQKDLPAYVGKTTKGGFPWMSVGLIGVVALLLILLNVAAVVLAHRGFPGTGFRLPGGPLIPIVAGVACLTQFFSYGLSDILAGAGAMLLGLVFYALRNHRRNLFSEKILSEIGEAIRNLETPLARSLCHPFGRHQARPERSS
jgi:amino acid transporter